LIRTLSIILTIALPLFCRAQVVLVGLPHQEEDQKKLIPANARTKAVALPFWEDFSATQTTYANPDLWFAGASIRVNNGMAIRPPSIGVATFDGVDSTGRPYNVNDVLAKGFADKLESKEIDLTTVDESLRNTLYLSFVYQMQGRGEIPDIGDRLLVSLKDDKGIWIPVETIENDGSFLPDVFYNSVIQVADPRFFHAAFKFRIQNFSRLSGPYDNWNVDYIYLNTGRTADDLIFPDRTISEPLTNLFGSYRAVPVKHFLLDNTVVAQPSVIATNLRTGNRQPITFSNEVTINYRTNDGQLVSVPPVFVDFRDTTRNLLLEKGVYTTVTANKLPDLSALSVQADSIGITFDFSLSTDDNVVQTDSTGDYVPEKYAPIDFRNNDTTRASYLLFNKYAYDDGVAEYAAGLNQPGAQLAFEYNLVGASEGYVTYLEMYFPRFGDETSQVIELRVWTDLTQEPVYTEVTTLQRTSQNEFWLKKLIEPVAVGKKFYIGWKQNAPAVIAAGLDKNTDAGDKMFYNTNGTWIANTLIYGCLMLRPIFGQGTDAGPTGLEETTLLEVYPNPSSGSFRFGGKADRILVYDMTGRSIGFQTETTLEETIITLPTASQGIFIIRAFIEGAVRTARVMKN
jgi:hypothetical protein